MKYLGRDIDLSKYRWHDEFRKGIDEYRAISPENDDISNNHNRFFLKRTIWTEDTHIGEFLGYLIAKKNGLKVCDAELYEGKSESQNQSPIYGVISYVSMSKDEEILSSELLMTKYMKMKEPLIRLRGSIDPDSVFEAVFALMNKAKRPYQEFLDFKQDFINMAVWDIKNLNTDRRMENWYLRRNRRTGKIDLYPMFDNEMILGFDDRVGEREFSEDELVKADRARKSSILSPEDLHKDKYGSDYETVMNFLLSKYPVQTKRALEAVYNFTEKDLTETLDSIEGIDDIRKIKVMQLFKKREKEIDRIYAKSQEKQRE